jgi:hypothetical protein
MGRRGVRCGSNSLRLFAAFAVGGTFFASRRESRLLFPFAPSKGESNLRSLPLLSFVLRGLQDPGIAVAHSH